MEGIQDEHDKYGVPYPQQQSGSPPLEVDSPSLHNGTWQWRIWLYWSEVGLLEQATITFRIGNTDVHLVDPPVTKPYILHPYKEPIIEHEITWNTDHAGWLYQLDNQTFSNSVSGSHKLGGWARTSTSSTEGIASLVWDGLDNYGTPAPGGVYALNVQATHWKSDKDQTMSEYLTVQKVYYGGAKSGDVRVWFQVVDKRPQDQVLPRAAVIDLYDINWNPVGSAGLGNVVLFPDWNSVALSISAQAKDYLVAVVTVYDGRYDRNHHQDKYAVGSAMAGADLDVTQTIGWVPAAYITQVESVQGDTLTVKHSEGFPPKGFIGIGWSWYRYDSLDAGNGILHIAEQQGEPIADQDKGEIVYLQGIDYAHCPAGWGMDPSPGALPHLTTVTAKTRLPGYIRFVLRETSHHPGYCSNAGTGTSADLGLVPVGLGEVTIEDGGMSALSGLLVPPEGGTAGVTVGIISYDFGAWGVLEATWYSGAGGPGAMAAVVDLRASATQAGLYPTFYAGADPDDDRITECTIPADYGHVHIAIDQTLNDSLALNADKVTLPGAFGPGPATPKHNELSDYWELEKEREWRATYSHWDGTNRTWNTSGGPQDPDFSDLTWDEEPKDPDWMGDGKTAISTCLSRRCRCPMGRRTRCMRGHTHRRLRALTSASPRTRQQGMPSACLRNTAGSSSTQ